MLNFAPDVSGSDRSGGQDESEEDDLEELHSLPEIDWGFLAALRAAFILLPEERSFPLSIISLKDVDKLFARKPLFRTCYSRLFLSVLARFFSVDLCFSADLGTRNLSSGDKRSRKILTRCETSMLTITPEQLDRNLRTNCKTYLPSSRFAVFWINLWLLKHLVTRCTGEKGHSSLNNRA